MSREQDPEASADQGGEQGGAGKEKRGERPRSRLEDFQVEIDPERIDEAVRSIADQVRQAVDQGRYTKVRIKYRGKPLMPDIPLAVFVATEAVTFWYAGLLRALVVNLGARTIIEVELIHDAVGKVEEGKELFLAGEVDAAEDKYREALRMKRDHPDALYHLGVLLRVTGRRKEAIECFEKVADLPGHALQEKALEALDRMSRGPRSL